MTDQDDMKRGWRRRVRDALRTERSDPHLKEARRHLHLDLLDIPERVRQYAGADSQVQATVIALLVRRIEEGQPGARAGGLAMIGNGLVAAATIVITVTSVIVAGFFGIAAAATDSETGSIAGVTTDGVSAFATPVIWIVFGALVVVLFIGWAVWNFQHANDQARAVRLAWLSLFESALKPTSAPVRRPRRPKGRGSSQIFKPRASRRAPRAGRARRSSPPRDRTRNLPTARSR